MKQTTNYELKARPGYATPVKDSVVTWNTIEKENTQIREIYFCCSMRQCTGVYVDSISGTGGSPN
jgi:hypothetical protein